MRQTLRYSLYTIFLLAVDYLLLRHFSAPSPGWLGPALLVVALCLVTVIWFPELLRRTWAVSAVTLRSRRNKPSYVVTSKTRKAGFYGRLLWPQFLYLFAGAAAIIYSLANMVILLFFMFMVGQICRTAFYGAQSITLPFGTLTFDKPQREEQAR
jgi:hypothetical protein